MVLLLVQLAHYGRNKDDLDWRMGKALLPHVIVESEEVEEDVGIWEDEFHRGF